MNSLAARIPACLVLLASCLCAAPGASAQLINGSFESGDFGGWTPTDLSAPLTPLDVVPISAYGYFGTITAPTDGDFSAATGFDGNGPGTISVAQEVTVSKSSPMVLVDYRAQWDLVNFGGGALARTFSVVVIPVGGVGSAGSFEVLRAPGHTVNAGTGWITAAVDLKAWANQTVSLQLAWFVPESFTGPAFSELDHVRLVGSKVPATEALSLKATLDLLQEGKDSLTLVMPVAGLSNFSPNGQSVTVHVGNLSTNFVLDFSGKGSNGSATLSAKPVPQSSDVQKFTFAVKQSDLLSVLSPSGLTNATTAKGGVTASVPVSVQIGSLTASRDVVVVWTATQDKTGKASGKAASEKQVGNLTVNLNFATANSDAASLSATAFTQPGFTPDGQTITLDIGSLERAYTLDASGLGTSAGGTVTVKRSKQNPAMQSVVLKIAGEDLQTALAADGMTNADTVPPGTPITLPIKIALGGRITELVVPTNWVAKAGKSGKDAGKL